MAVLAAFGVIGLISHEDALSLKVLTRAVLIFPAAWLAIAPIGGVFRPHVSRIHLLRTWLVVGAIALVARALLFDRPLFTAFFVIVLVGDALFLLAWRTVYDWLLAPRERVFVSR